MMSNNPPKCPNCGSDMVLRTARQGKFAGKQFYGCQNYPKCKEIVNFDGGDNGSTESSGDTVDSSIFIGFPKIFSAASTLASTQPKFFQNIGLPHLLCDLVNGNLTETYINEIRSLSQWRLDFPFPTANNSLTSHDRSVISEVDKLLRRGSTTICTPEVERLALSAFGTNRYTNKTWGLFINRISNLPNLNKEFNNFDSEEEKLLYNDIFVQNNISHWVIPQVTISSLIENYPGDGITGRVDFFLSAPNNKRYIIEVDGVQHSEITAADQQRDSILSKNGFEVIRIPTHQIRERQGDQYSYIKQIAQNLHRPNPVSISNDETLELLLLKMSTQLQLSVLEAVKGEYLPFQNGSEWNIAISCPEWVPDDALWQKFMSTALEDLIALINDIQSLYFNEPKNISFSLKPNDSNNSEIIINFGADSNLNGKPTFSISDIFVPFDISNPYQPTSALDIKSPNEELAERLLYFLFRKTSFLPGQWEGLERILTGKDAIILLPTGAGKSITFQLAALILPGIGLVIDPLISLINDQVDNLYSYGINNVIGITGQLTSEEKKRANSCFANGMYVFCYIAPERLQMQDFRDMLRSVTVTLPISVLSIDEAHCVSEWGHDFRVSYLNIAHNAREFCQKDGKSPPLIALTGTASRTVLKDIRRELEIPDFEAVITPSDFNRPELKFNILTCRSDQKKDRLNGVLTGLPAKFNVSPSAFTQSLGERSYTGLVFYPHVNGAFGVEQGQSYLLQHNPLVGLYSGTAPKNKNAAHWERSKRVNAQKFKKNELTALACTSAFGMGIDKPNVRYTIHMNLPKSIEAFYQEAGRAGRDHKDAQCYLIVSNDYSKRNAQLLDPRTKLDEITKVMDNLKYSEQDDITRALYFHTMAFKGIADEITNIRFVLSQIDNLSSQIKLDLEFSRDQVSREKALHRLVLLGVIENYTINYARNTFTLITTGNDQEANLKKLVSYITNYDLKLALRTEEIARKQIDELSHAEFILFLADKLIHDFIYSIIEMSRRSSLNEMLQACITDPTDHGIRSRMLNYLEFGQYTDQLDNLRQNVDDIDIKLFEILEEVGSTNDAAELRGQTSRMLEAYPNNPGLLLVRSISEVLCRDKNPEVVSQFFSAWLGFATEETTWFLDQRIIAKASCLAINTINRSDSELAQELTVSLFETVRFENVEIIRSIVVDLSPECAFYPMQLLTSRLNVNLKNIIDSEEK